jgi:hypothetical protein
MNKRRTFFHVGCSFALALGILSSAARAQCETGVWENIGSFGLASSGNTLVAGETNGLLFPGRVLIIEREGFEWKIVQELSEPVRCGDCFVPIETCEGFCGGQAPWGCFCDEACCLFLDCCPDEPITCGNCDFLLCNELYGHTVAIDGDWAAVSDPRADCNKGRVYIYNRGVDGTWALFQELPAPEGVTLDGGLPVMLALFGHTLEFGDELLAVGVPHGTFEGMGSAGIVFLYRFNGNDWFMEGYVVDPEMSSNDHFGVSIAIDGDVLAISANGNNNMHGSVFVYRWIDDAWMFEQQLDGILTTQTNYGADIDLRGDLLLVGAPKNQGGRAYAYRHDGAKWNLEQVITVDSTVGNSAQFGWRVEIHASQNRLLISANGDSHGGFLAGSVFIFDYIDEEWVETKKLLPSLPADGFGWSMALMDDFAAICAINSSDLYFYTGFNGEDCNKSGEPDACDIFTGDSKDINANLIPDECEEFTCAGDLDGSGSVDIFDLLELLSAWGPCPTGGRPAPPCDADLDASGEVDIFDLLELLSAWGDCP